MADATDIAVMRRKAPYALGQLGEAVSNDRLPALVAWIGPKISIDRSCSGSVAGNSVNGDVCRRTDSRFWAQVVHFVIMLQISVTMDGQ